MVSQIKQGQKQNHLHHKYRGTKVEQLKKEIAMDRAKCAKRRQSRDEGRELDHSFASSKVDSMRARECVQSKSATTYISKQVQSTPGYGHTHSGRQLSSFILFASAVILLNLCPLFHLDYDQTSSLSKSSPDVTPLNTGTANLASTMSQLNNPAHLPTSSSPLRDNDNQKQRFEYTTQLVRCLEFVKLMFRNPIRMSKPTTRFTLAEARVLGKMAKVWYIKKKIKKLSKKLKKHTIAVPVFTAIPIYEHSYYPQPHVTHVTPMHHHAAASSLAPSAVLPNGAPAASEQQLATAASDQRRHVAAYRMAPAAYAHHGHQPYQPHGAGGHHIINAYTPSQPLFVDDTGGLYGHYGNAYGRYDGGYHVW